MVLSLENHCSPSQQEVMADNLQSILGDALLSDVLDDYPHELPSPEVTFCLRRSSYEQKKVYVTIILAHGTGLEINENA